MSETEKKENKINPKHEEEENTKDEIRNQMS